MSRLRRRSGPKRGWKRFWHPTVRIEAEGVAFARLTHAEENVRWPPRRENRLAIAATVDVVVNEFIGDLAGAAGSVSPCYGTRGSFCSWPPPCLTMMCVNLPCLILHERHLGERRLVEVLGLRLGVQPFRIEDPGLSIHRANALPRQAVALVGDLDGELGAAAVLAEESVVELRIHLDRAASGWPGR